MLRKRVITVLTFNNGVLFRTKDFIPDYRYTANFIDNWSVDEIVILDITRPNEGDKENFYSCVMEFSENCFVPLSVGGGVRSLEDFETLLRKGADKIVISTGAFENHDLIVEASKLYGSQCVVLCMDVKKHDNMTYEVFTHFGAKPCGLSPVEWAKKAVALGAGEILVQAIDLDGSLEGYDLALIQQVAEAVDVPILANCGAGKWKDFQTGIETGNASAVCTQNIYHFTENSIKSAKKYLSSKGLNVRL